MKKMILLGVVFSAIMVTNIKTMQPVSKFGKDLFETYSGMKKIGKEEQYQKLFKKGRVEYPEEKEGVLPTFNIPTEEKLVLGGEDKNLLREKLNELINLVKKDLEELKKTDEQIEKAYIKVVKLCFDVLLPNIDKIDKKLFLFYENQIITVHELVGLFLEKYKKLQDDVQKKHEEEIKIKQEDLKKQLEEEQNKQEDLKKEFEKKLQEKENDVLNAKKELENKLLDVTNEHKRVKEKLEEDLQKNKKENDEKLEEKQKENNQKLEEKQKEIDQSKEELKNKTEEAEKEKNELNKKISEITEEKNKLEQKNTEKDNEIEKLKKEIEELQEKNKKLEEKNSFVKEVFKSVKEDFNLKKSQLGETKK